MRGEWHRPIVRRSAPGLCGRDTRPRPGQWQDLWEKPGRPPREPVGMPGRTEGQQRVYRTIREAPLAPRTEGSLRRSPGSKAGTPGARDLTRRLIGHSRRAALRRLVESGRERVGRPNPPGRNRGNESRPVLQAPARARQTEAWTSGCRDRGETLPRQSTVGPGRTRRSVRATELRVALTSVAVNREHSP